MHLSSPIRPDGTADPLYAFVRESNAIEGITRDPTQREIEAHHVLLSLRRVRVSALELFVREIVGAELRRRVGMNVRVGPYVPPLGGPHVEQDLAGLLDAIHVRRIGPWEAHQAYETLHPFLDGNGRSGRVLWAWQMGHMGSDPFALPFLHAVYYQALGAGR